MELQAHFTTLQKWNRPNTEPESVRVVGRGAADGGGGVDGVGGVGAEAARLLQRGHSTLGLNKVNKGNQRLRESEHGFV